jgi:hypothetical protein
MTRTHAPSDLTDRQWQIGRTLRRQTAGGRLTSHRPVDVDEFAVLPKHWIVERTFTCLARCRESRFLAVPARSEDNHDDNDDYLPCLTLSTTAIRLFLRGGCAGSVRR